MDVHGFRKPLGITAIFDVIVFIISKKVRNLTPCSITGEVF